VANLFRYTSQGEALRFTLLIKRNIQKLNVEVFAHQLATGPNYITPRQAACLQVWETICCENSNGLIPYLCDQKVATFIINRDRMLKGELLCVN
jgi:hypothetical protein